MAGETVITVVGNLTSDPELRYTQNGLAVANFTIASTPRNFDRAANDWKDGEALFLRASVWREFAEHVAGSLTKGSRVIATGRLQAAFLRDERGREAHLDRARGRRDRPLAALRDRDQVTRAASGGGGGGGGAVGGARAGGSRTSRGPASRARSCRLQRRSRCWNTPGSYSDDTPF